MRMRNKKWARPELTACPYFVDEPESVRGKWQEQFARPQPLHVELGCGKCVSTAQMALDNPDVNFLAVDLVCSVLGVGRRNIEAAYAGRTVDNLVLTHFDIMWIEKYLAPEDRADRIIISFCNPWNQKSSQAKRRLTHPRQLMQYRAFLRPGGEIHFKTDDDNLFRVSRTYLRTCGFEEIYCTEDLHGDQEALSRFSNYESEHEKRYAAEGVPIKFLAARMTRLPPEADEPSA